MNPIESLRHEHQVILLTLQAAKKEAARAERTGHINAPAVRRLLDFFGAFVDRCHHAKEERYLFQAMRRRGSPQDEGPILAMIHEHEQGRRLLLAVAKELPAAETGERRAVAMLAKYLGEYTELMVSHIDKEDNVLFDVAQGLLTPQDLQTLATEFDRLESQEIGEGVHERYHHLAHELAEM